MGPKVTRNGPMGELSRARPILLASRRSVGDVHYSLGFSLDGYCNFRWSGGQWTMHQMSSMLADWASFSCSSLDQLAILEPSPKGFGELPKCSSAHRKEHILNLLLLASLGLPRSQLSSKHGVVQLGAPSRFWCATLLREMTRFCKTHFSESWVAFSKDQPLLTFAFVKKPSLKRPPLKRKSGCRSDARVFGGFVRHVTT
uniref:Uncharacterized protein n=1 Tax=Solanum tuberosum TaxID=4113 RepID=M1AEV2_SOLTU